MERTVLHNLINELQAILPEEPIPEMLELYVEFAQMETPVEQGIQVDWIRNVEDFYRLSDFMRTSHKFLLNSESFLKKVLYAVDEQAYRDCVSNHRLGLYRVMDKLGMLELFPQNVRLDTYDISGTSDPVCRAIAKTYQLRNNASHTSENWTISQMFENINAIMIATMKAVWDNRGELRKRVSSATSNKQFGIKKLLEELVESYDKKIGEGFQYVPLLWESGGDNHTKQILLDELLSDNQILLSGDAGCGKSTSLDQLEYQAARKYISGETSVIPVKLAMINESPSRSLMEMICHKLNIPADYCESLLEKNSILLMVDGLNELTTVSECKKQFVISLEQFIVRHPGIQVIVTDRRYSPFPIRLEKTYYLKPLEKEDIIRYAKTRAECTDHVLELLKVFLESPSFTELEFTPLLINQLLLALSAHHKLPEDHTELIGVYLESLMTREYVEKRDLNAAPGKLDLFLMKLAVEMPQDEGYALHQAMKLFANIASEYALALQSDVCINLAVQLGILQQSGRYLNFVLDEYRAYYFMKALDENL